ncbi:MAG: hypothetical protein AUK44_10370 [Porphyromonadaceae bacterium CG2_30_38_12]|nr:MAG: hypothetical protein AUK44_10370 [Porphyromonadaceae bacterium CG2_30_38_12]
MKKKLLFILIIASFINGYAAVNYFFSVEFTNKNNTPYSLTNPSAYLSARSIERRASFGIPIDSTDLPVNQQYIQQIVDSGFVVHSVSKWLNRATIYVSDSTIIQKIRQLAFVKSTQYTGKVDPANLAPSSPQKAKTDAIVTDYTGQNQLKEIQGDYLHNQGFTGRGMYIGVIDGGFKNVHINPGFDSLRLQGRLLKTKNIAHPGRTVFQGDNHGALVLSTMAGNLVSSNFRGTAPHANYCLIITEVGNSESLFETDFWVSGIEYADSLGVDVINSSLGYHTFDDPSLNFSFSQMNGKTVRSSIAATMGAHKGIIIAVSQGNDGLKTWKMVGSPADADDIFSVGGLQSGIPSNFSSFGPTADGRIKPETCAKATNTTLIEATGIVSSNETGTSFASPIIAGMLACLLQHYKQINPTPNLYDFRQAVIKSGSLYMTPTDQLGYGLANFKIADEYLSTLSSVRNIAQDKAEILEVKQNGNSFTFLKSANYYGKTLFVKLFNSTGMQVFGKQLVDDMTTIETPETKAGIYILKINTGIKVVSQKILVR